MSTKSRWESGYQQFHEGKGGAVDIGETAHVMSPFLMADDFTTPSLVIPAVGALESGVEWAKKIVGTSTVAAVASAPCGVIACTLAAAAAAQVAELDKSDNRQLVLGQGLVFEARVRLATALPTIGAIVCVGLCGNYNADVDAVAESAWFRWDIATGGLIQVESDDTANEKSKVSTGVTVIADQWVVLKIDCSVITDVRFYINGSRVAASTTFNMSTVPTLTLQPVARISAAAADSSAGALQVDYVRCWQRRS